MGLFSVLSLALLGLQVSQEPRVICTLEKEQIYLGESVVYQVEARNFEDPQPPNMSEFADMDVQFLGDQDQDSTQMTIIQRQVKTIRKFGRVYSYRLTPKKGGRLRLPGPTVEHAGGKSLQGNPLNLNVIEPQSQSTAILEVHASSHEVFPLQDFTITLDVYIEELPKEYDGDSDPLAVLRQSPALGIPWAQPEEGLRTSDLDTWLGKVRISRGAGFSINNLTVGEAFSLFQTRLAIFQLPSQAAVRDVGNQQRTYRRYRLTRDFQADRPGTYTFGPASLKGQLATGILNGRLQGQQIYALSGQVQVRVAGVPVENRPSSYSGAIGEFQVGAQLAPTEVRVGDPMTLTLTIRGKGRLEDILPPRIHEVEGIKDQFRVYDATAENRGKRRIFTYSVRPLQETLAEFPALPFAYFQPEDGKFVETHTTPIPITVTAAEKLDTDDIVSSPSASGRPRNVEELSGGYVANFSDTTRLLQRHLSPVTVGFYCATLFIGYFALALGIGRVRKLNEDPQRRRRRGAKNRAQQSLAVAHDQLRNSQLREGSEACTAAWTNLFADLANNTAEGMAPGDVTRLAEQLGVQPAYVEKLRIILEDCDAARFGGMTNGLQLAEASESLSRAVLPTLTTGNSPKNKAATMASCLVLGLVFGAGSSCRKAAPPDLVSRFQTTQTDFLSAQSGEEYLSVAAELEAMVSEYPHSGPLFFNLGNAYAQAGRRGQAVAAYRKAQRLLPGDPYLENNLKIAQGAAPSLDDDQRTLTNQLLFWKRWLGPVELGWMTVFFATVAFLLGTASMFRSAAAWKRLRTLGLLLTFLSGASYLLVTWQNQPNRKGVVAVEKAVARKGNSESYEPAFTEPLQEATEFFLVEQRPPWLHIQLPNGPKGWIREENARLY